VNREVEDEESRRLGRSCLHALFQAKEP
jgi:hypothetical protein